MATSVPTDSSPRLAAREIPLAPKSSATRALAERLESHDFTPSAALALARAAVDPADVRRRLDRPTPIRVPGAALFTVDMDVWAPAVLPYIANYRESDGRIFPADQTVAEADAPEYPPIRRPKGDPDGRPILELEVQDREHLVHAVEGSIGYLTDHNNLADSVAERGVMFPVTLVATTVTTADGKTIDVPATADGSSRTSAALEVLEVSAAQAIGKLQSDPRALAGMIGRIRSIFDRPMEQVSEHELGEANALILPARLIIGFEPDASGDADFAKAVHNFVDLTHGELPPSPWPDTARIDAKADSVVAQLEQADLITPNRASYFEGMLSSTEAKRLRYPIHADARGLMICSTLSKKDGGFHGAIRTAIIQPSERKHVTKAVKAELSAELALRGARGILTPKEMSGARDVLANLYASPSIWEQELKPSGKAPEELLDEALKERKTSSDGPATAELGALGGFWLAARRLLREARFFTSERVRDGRTPSTVLGTLMESEWGLRVLARAVEDGREGDSIWQVDRDGNRVSKVTGGFLTATHEWIRGDVVPPEGEEPPVVGDEGEVEPLPGRLLLDRRKRLEASVQSLEQRHADMREILVDGEVFVERRGLPPEVTDDIRERLEWIKNKLVVYGSIWSRSSASDEAEEETARPQDEEPS